MADGSVRVHLAAYRPNSDAFSGRGESRQIGRFIMQFVGLDLRDSLLPDANTIRLFRETSARAGSIDRGFERFNAMLPEKGWRAMGGRIVNATFASAHRSRLISKLEGDTARQPEKAVGCSAAAILDDLGEI
jgi:hypothetical protein